MPRTMTSGMATAIAAGNAKPAFLVELGFNGTTVYLWTGRGNLSWNGQTWLGLSNLIGISTAEDAATVEAKGITFTLGVADPSLLAAALTDFLLGQPAILYLALFSGGTLISDPIIIWSGRTDQPTYDIAGDAATLAVNCETELIEMNTAIDRRLTNQDQQTTWPGDLGLMFVDGIQEITTFWGQYPGASNNI